MNKKVLLSKWYSDVLSRCISLWLSRNYDESGSDEMKTLMKDLLSVKDIREIHATDATFTLVIRSIITSEVEGKDKLLENLASQLKFDTMMISLLLFFANKCTVR